MGQIKNKRLTALRRFAANSTGMNLRTMYRHSEADVIELREIVQLFKDRKLVRASEFAKMVKMGRGKVYRLIYSGSLEAYLVFDSWFVPLDQLIKVGSI